MSTISDEQQDNRSAEADGAQVSFEAATLEAQHARAVKRLAVRWRGLWWSVAAIGGYFLLVLAVRFVWGNLAEARLEAVITEYRAKGEPMRVEDFPVPEVADADNAALLYQQAIATLPSFNPLDVSILAQHAEWRDQWLAFESVYDECLARHAETLDLVTQATALPQVDWGTRLQSPVINQLFPSLADQRQLAKVIMLAAIDAHQRGDDAAALRHVHETLLLGDRIGVYQPTLIHHLVSIGINSLACHTIERKGHELALALGEPARAEAAALIETLLDDAHVAQRYRLAICLERLMFIDTCEVLYHEPQAFNGVAGTVLQQWGNIPLMRPIFLTQAAQAVDYYDTSTDFTQPAKSVDYLDDRISDLPTAVNMTVGMVLLPSLNRAKTLSGRGLAKRRMAAITLALRMYELDHGERPLELARLTPEYLPTVPIDPFDPQGLPIRYLPDTERPRLYSVNDNHTDNAGEIVLNASGRLEFEDVDLSWFLDENPIVTPPDPNVLQAALAQAGEDDREVE